MLSNSNLSGYESRRSVPLPMPVESLNFSRAASLETNEESRSSLVSGGSGLILLDDGDDGSLRASALVNQWEHPGQVSSSLVLPELRNTANRSSQSGPRDLALSLIPTSAVVPIPLLLIDEVEESITQAYQYVDARLIKDLAEWRTKTFTQVSMSLVVELNDIFKWFLKDFKTLLWAVDRLVLLPLPEEPLTNLRVFIEGKIQIRLGQSERLRNFLNKYFCASLESYQRYEAIKDLGVRTVVEALIKLREIFSNKNFVEFSVLDLSNQEHLDLCAILLEGFNGSNSEVSSGQERKDNFTKDLTNIIGKIKNLSIYFRSLFAIKSYHNHDRVFVNSRMGIEIIKLYYTHKEEEDTFSFPEMLLMLSFMLTNEEYMVAIAQDLYYKRIEAKNPESLGDLSPQVALVYYKKTVKGILEEEMKRLSREMKNSSVDTRASAVLRIKRRDRQVAFAQEPRELSFHPASISERRAFPPDVPENADGFLEFHEHLPAFVDNIFYYLEDQEVQTCLQITNPDFSFQHFQTSLLAYMQDLCHPRRSNNTPVKILCRVGLTTIANAFLDLYNQFMRLDYVPAQDYLVVLEGCVAIIQTLLSLFIAAMSSDLTVDLQHAFQEDIENLSRNCGYVLEYLIEMFKKMKFDYTEMYYVHVSVCKYIISGYYQHYHDRNIWVVDLIKVLQMLVEDEQYLDHLMQIIFIHRGESHSYATGRLGDFSADILQLKSELQQNFLRSIEMLKVGCQKDHIAHTPYVCQLGEVVEEAKDSRAKTLLHVQESKESLRRLIVSTRLNNISNTINDIVEAVDEIFEHLERVWSGLPEESSLLQDFVEEKERLTKFLQDFFIGCYQQSQIGKFLQNVTIGVIVKAFSIIRSMARGEVVGISPNLFYEFTAHNCVLIVETLIEEYVRLWSLVVGFAPLPIEHFYEDIQQIGMNIFKVFKALEELFRTNHYKALSISYVKGDICIYLIKDYYRHYQHNQHYSPNISAVLNMLLKDATYLDEITEIVCLEYENTRVRHSSPVITKAEQKERFKQLFISKLRTLDIQVADLRSTALNDNVVASTNAVIVNSANSVAIVNGGAISQANLEMVVSPAVEATKVDLKDKIMKVVNRVLKFSEDYLLKDLESCLEVNQALTAHIKKIELFVGEGLGYSPAALFMLRFSKLRDMLFRNDKAFRELILTNEVRLKIEMLNKTIKQALVERKSLEDFFLEIFSDDPANMVYQKLGLDSLVEAFGRLRITALALLQPTNHYEFDAQRVGWVLKELLFLFKEKVKQVNLEDIATNFEQDITKISSEISNMPTKLQWLLGEEVYPHISFVPAAVCVLIIRNYYNSRGPLNLVDEKINILTELLTDEIYLEQVSWQLYKDRSAAHTLYEQTILQVLRKEIS